MPVSINNVSGLDQFQGTIERFWEIMRNSGAQGRRVFPLGFFPKLVDHPLGIDALSRANRNRAAQCKFSP